MEDEELENNGGDLTIAGDGLTIDRSTDINAVYLNADGASLIGVGEPYFHTDLQNAIHSIGELSLEPNLRADSISTQIIKSDEKLEISVKKVEFNDCDEIDFKDTSLSSKLENMRLDKFDDNPAAMEIQSKFGDMSLGDILVLLIAHTEESKDFEGSLLQELMKSLPQA